MSFLLVAGRPGFLLSFNVWYRPPLEVWGESRDSSWVETGELAPILRWCGDHGLHLELWQELRGYSWVATGISGKLLRFIKWFKPPFEFWEGTLACSWGASGQMGIILQWGRKLRVPLELLQRPQGTSCVGPWKSSVLRAIPHSPLQLKRRLDFRGFSGIPVFLTSFNRGIRPRLIFRHGNPLSSRVLKGVSGLLSS